MHEKDETRKKGSTDSGLRSILTVTLGGTFLLFARCRSLAAAWRVLVAVVSSRRRFERKRAKCAWRVARPVLTRTLRILDGQMPFPEANGDGRFAGSKLGLSETSQPH